MYLVVSAKFKMYLFWQMYTMIVWKELLPDQLILCGNRWLRMMSITYNI